MRPRLLARVLSSVTIVGIAATAGTADDRMGPSLSPPARRPNPPAAHPAPADSKLKPAQLPEAPAIVPDAALPTLDGQSLSLNAALYGALTGNPDLVSVRQNSPATAEAVEVARRFPTTLNPTIWIDIRPLTFEPKSTGGYNPAQTFLYFSWRQPLELGHQTTHRHNIAKAAFNQAHWNIVQAELTTMVQTYRLFQTAAYRRERLRVATRLAEFNDKLLVALRRRLEVNPASAADVALTEIEIEATRQLVEAARNDYAVALTDMHNQIGTPDTAGQSVPVDPFQAPASMPSLDESTLIGIALSSRPEIHAARAAVAGAHAAILLAKGDRRPTPVVGPVYERDQAGVQYGGFVAIVPIPVVNNGAPLVRQREAEHRRAVIALQQVEQRTITQVKAAAAKWNQAKRLVERTQGLTETLAKQITQVERLFEANQTDLTKLLQARQRLIQLENAELDAVWQATQAHADLLIALGAPHLIQSLVESTQPPTQAAAVPVAAEAKR